ncbi:zinc-binding dehydrogenase [Kocuria sp. CPCC 205292]|uniref:zinc-binding dehydrogenase n=1 Tax=Kocuria cellulosilytica TaxID=3071451 RepID=UPI0034D69CA7
MDSRPQHPRGTMRAITQLGYGGTEVLSLAEVETPVTGDDEVQERFVALRPTTVDAVHASSVPVSGTTALQGLRLAGVAPGQNVLVNGASGGVGGGRYDVLFDLVADHPLGRVRRSLTRHGTLLVAAGKGGKVLGPVGRIVRASTMSLFVPQRLRPPAARRNGGDLAELTRRIDAGEVVPVVDEVFPRERAAEAITRLDSGEVRGKVVITV